METLPGPPSAARAAVAGALLALLPAAPAAALDKATCDGPADVAALAAGQWCEVTGSRLDGPGIRPDRYPGGNSGFAGLFAWSGGAYDRKRDRYVIWGGGHMDYAGNELYAFDLGTLRWTRVNEPSANSGGDERSGCYPSADGSVAVDRQQPRSRHTYN